MNQPHRHCSGRRPGEIALVAALAKLLGVATPAFAAGSYGGAGTPFQVSQWNIDQGNLPSPPASVASGSAITGVTCTLNYSSPGALPASQHIYTCYTSTSNCFPASRFTNSTSSFNGLPAKTTQLLFAVYWNNGFSSGTIAGGPVSFTDSVTVNYS